MAGEDGDIDLAVHRTYLPILYHLFVCRIWLRRKMAQNNPVVSIPSLFVRPVILKAPPPGKIVKEVYARIKRLQMNVPINKDYSVDKMMRVQLHLSMDNRPARWVRATRMDLLEQDLGWIYGDNIDSLQLACAIAELQKQKKIRIRYSGLIELMPAKGGDYGAKSEDATRNVHSVRRPNKKDDRLQEVRKTPGRKKLQPMPV
jgi:hypothetical protein